MQRKTVKFTVHVRFPLDLSATTQQSGGPLIMAAGTDIRGRFMWANVHKVAF